MEVNKKSPSPYSVVNSLLNSGDSEMNKAGFLISMNLGKNRNHYETVGWVWWWRGMLMLSEYKGRAPSPLWGKFGYSSWKIGLLRTELENE